MTTETKRGGARWRTGPTVRHIILDADVADKLRTLAKERRLINPDVSEADTVNKIANDLIRAAWDEAHEHYQAMADQQDE